MKTQYTNYTPIPPQVPKQLAIEILQSHGEMITVNPLVLEYHPIKAPRDCPNDEYYSTWYEITQRIQFVPGFKKLGSSKVSFKGCFHDMPWGVQTHMYIPMGVDLRNKWQIRGTQPGEPPEPRELGSGAPSSGIYLKEEVEIKCNPLAVSFVKKETKAASLIMVERMLKKAELLDAGVLQAMFENGKLKTFNPQDRSLGQPPVSPGPASPGFPNRYRSDSSQDPNSRMSTYSQISQFSQHTQVPYRDAPNALGQIAHPEGRGLAVEMPGDFLYPAEQANQNKPLSDRHSQASGSDRSGDNRNSRWSYISSDQMSNTGTSRPQSHATSPLPQQRSFTAELPGSGHKDFEVRKSSTPSKTTPPPPTAPTQQQQQPSQPSQSPQPPQTTQSPQPQQTYGHQTYNPQNYARFSGNQYA